MEPDQLRRLFRRWTMPLVALVVIGAAVGYLISRIMTPVYTASGSVLVVAGPGESSGASAIALTPTEATTTAASLLTARPLLQEVAKQLGLSGSVDDLARQVSAAPETNSELVDVTVKDPSALRAAQIANAVMSDYVTEVDSQNAQRINQAGAALQAQIAQVQARLTQEQQQLQSAAGRGAATAAIQAAIAADTAAITQLNIQLGSLRATQAESLEAVSVSAAAVVPDAPSAPSKTFNTAGGAVIGLLAGLAVAGLTEFLGQGLRTAEDVRRRIGIPCLAVIPVMPSQRKPIKTRADGQQETAFAEAYRRLRTNLIFSAPDDGIKSLVITSVRPGEGKTYTAANLAVAIAGSDMRVLLIDADMRRPSQHRMFQASMGGGLSEMIAHTNGSLSAINEGIQQTQYENLAVVTSGLIPPNPSELLASKRANLVLESLSNGRDITIIDTPPAGAVTDPLGLAAEASATILVVESGRTNAAQARQVLSSLDEVGANVVGIVLNKARRRSVTSYYYQYEYTYTPKDAQRPGGDRSPQVQDDGIAAARA